MTTYAGFEVAPWRPDWKGAGTSRSLTRPKVRVDAGTNAFEDKVFNTTARGARPFRVVLDGRAEVTAFRAFVEARGGRHKAFWVPTWVADLELAAPAGSGDATLTVAFSSYTRFYELTDFGRRHLAVIFSDATAIYRRVIESVDNVDGTETLTLHTTHGVALVPGDGHTISFLTLCRLVSDVVSLRWLSFNLAVAELALIELPREVPVA